MIDFIVLVLSDFISGSYDLIKKLLLIIVPIMIGLEIIKQFDVLDYINKHTLKITKHLGISKNANLPLIIGVIIGLTYGAGVLINSYNNGEMDNKDVYLVGIFLALCHAIIEDTLIFLVLGANGFIVIFVRLTFAIVVTIIVNKYLNKKNSTK